jgi:hypothetical protein
MDKQYLAWLAGAFEGEGTFNVYLTKYSARARVSVSQVDYRFLEPFEKFGGKIYGPFQNKGPRQKYYLWTISEVAASHGFIVAILPYLVTRREQALAFISLCEYLEKTRYKHRRNEAFDTVLNLVEEVKRGRYL